LPENAFADDGDTEPLAERDAIELLLWPWLSRTTTPRDGRSIFVTAPSNLMWSRNAAVSFST